MINAGTFPHLSDGDDRSDFAKRRGVSPRESFFLKLFYLFHNKRYFNNINVCLFIYFRIGASPQTRTSNTAGVPSGVHTPSTDTVHAQINENKTLLQLNECILLFLWIWIHIFSFFGRTAMKKRWKIKNLNYVIREAEKISRCSPIWFPRMLCLLLFILFRIFYFFNSICLLNLIYSNFILFWLQMHVEEITEASIKRCAAQLERRIKKNQHDRIKFANNPEK